VRGGVRLPLERVEDWHSTRENARLTGVTESMVRQMLIAGELEGKRDHVTERWKVPQHVIRARWEERRSLETARATAQAQVPRACAGEGWGRARAATARGNPRPARKLRGPIVRHADLRFLSAPTLAQASIATPTSNGRCFVCLPLEVRWVRSAVPGSRRKQARSG
jgi:hypothetical protein